MKVILDTSFLLRLVTGPVKGLDELEARVGKLEYLVPARVLHELRSLSGGCATRKTRDATRALEYARTLQVLKGAPAGEADNQILAQARRIGLPVATLDRSLRKRLREQRITVLTCRQDRVVLEGPLP